MSINDMQLKMPATESPVIRGTNSSEFDIFQMNKIHSVLKEEAQNSLDATDAEKSGAKTVMDLHLYNYPTKLLPCYHAMLQMIIDNETYWAKKVTSEKTKEVFRNMKNVLSNEMIRILRISDYNNIGLSQDQIDGRCSPYESLVFGEGVSDKASGSGGSYGLGKNAAFTASAIRTVLYSTYNKEGNSLSIGVIKAPSYKKDGKDYEGYGFLCNKNKSGYEPTSYINLDDSFNRAGRLGTDKYILGYNVEETEEEIEKQVCIAAFNNFFAAFLNDTLLINYNDTIEISKDTIEDIANKYEKKDGEIEKTSYNQYMTMKNPDQKRLITLFEKDDVEIYFRQHVEGKRRVGIVRRTGMKIFDHKGYPTGVQFDAVIHIKGIKANDFFKQFENGEHNAWKMSEIMNNPEYKKYYTMLTKPVREMVAECQASICGDAVDVEGVSDFLPDAYIESKRSGTKSKKGNIKETLTNEIETSQKTKAKKYKREKVERTFATVDENGVETVEMKDSAEAYNACDNRQNKTKGRDGISTPVAEQSDNGVKVSYADSDLDPEKDYFAIGKKIESKKVSVKMKNHGNGFKLLLSSEVGFEEGFVEVKISGETLSGVAKIKSATINGEPAEISKSKDKFKIKDMNALTSKEINIDIDGSEKLAMEVYLYENTRK